MAVINTIELEGASETSWGEAAREALREAAKTIRGITKLEVLGVRALVRDDRIAEYRTTVRLHFTVEPRR
jgi:flavin-binding protein dodecin